MPVSFIGAGPGDPELLTLKGYKRIKEADVVVYAGSLINPEILKYADDNAEIFDSKDMVLEEIVDIVVKSVRKGKKVVRLHTGDLSIYSAITEQIAEIKKAGIEVEVIPGISSYQAAAAQLGKEYTVPGGTQTVILTRMTGRTPVPDSENIASLARHNSSLVLFLSMGIFDNVIKELKSVLSPKTPVAVAHKVTWPDEIIISGTLSDISKKVKKFPAVNKTSLVIIGNFLKTCGEKSKLYDKYFSHEYRRGIK
ncbi:MAG: precorrin-4 C(11)-methyltransferase [Actinobacteria bacterium]|nr:precorrin-4 C(11)-methyltransferase [Actinomycetota bacterium]